jgi:hypothetical protein
MKFIVANFSKVYTNSFQWIRKPFNQKFILETHIHPQNQTNFTCIQLQPVSNSCKAFNSTFVTLIPWNSFRSYSNNREGKMELSHISFNSSLNSTHALTFEIDKQMQGTMLKQFLNILLFIMAILSRALYHILKAKLLWLSFVCLKFNLRW